MTISKSKIASKKLLILRNLFLLLLLGFTLIQCKSTEVSPDNALNFVGSYSQPYTEYSGFNTTTGTYKAVLSKKDTKSLLMTLINTYVTKSSSGKIVEQNVNTVNLVSVSVIDEANLLINELISSNGNNYSAKGTGKLVGKNLSMELTSNDGKNVATQKFIFIKD